MPGFYTLYRFIKAISEREAKEGKRLNLSSAATLDPRFKVSVKEQLGLSDEDLKGLIGAMHYFNLVTPKGYLAVKPDPEEILQAIEGVVEYKYTIIKLLSASKILASTKREIPGALSFVCELKKELAPKIFVKPKRFPSLRSTPQVVLDVANMHTAFIVIPVNPIRGLENKEPSRTYPRHERATLLALIELGGIAQIRTLFDHLVNTDRLGMAEEFVSGLSKLVIVHQLAEIIMASQRAQRARLALARSVRSGDPNDHDVSVDRVQEFSSRLYDVIGRKRLEKVGFKAVNKRVLLTEVSQIIEESVPHDANEFINAYGEVRVAFENINEIKKLIELQ